MSILTINHNIDLVNDFITSITGGENSYYCFVARAEPWTDANGAIDDSNVPLSNTSISQVEQGTYQSLIYGKLLTSSDVNYMVPRYNWTSNTVYSSYDDTDPNLYNENFYVITDTNDVFKCINNGYTIQNPNGVPSLYKPNIKSVSGNFQTPDGYIWKYMFTCDPVIYNNFQSSSYIPVTPNNSVSGNAIPGTIDNIILTNGGVNYQVYEEGFLQSVVNNYVVQLPATSSAFNDYYTGSSIYFKAGFGGGQISQISHYDGTNKLVYINPPFNYYQNLQLSNVNGFMNIGNIINQELAYITYYYKSGFMNIGDVLVQTETGSYGVITHSNTSTVVIYEQSNGISLNYPMYDTSYSPVQKNGTVTISNNSLYVNAISGNYFTNDYFVDSYILVGSNANTNLRRVVAVNSSVITVNYPFNNSIIGANCYIVNNAISVDSVVENLYQGSIVYNNLTSIELAISNTTPLGSLFTIGETAVIVDGSNTSQGSNGTVSFSNSSYLILTNVSGNTQNLANLYAYGLYSEAKSYINSNISYPNVTVSTNTGDFQSGLPIIATYANGVPTGNAMVVSSYTSPDELSEYIISPSVTIQGDGNGALAYAYVDTSSNNPALSVSSIVLINNGENYTIANASITSNNLYGNGATSYTQISPVNGHGYDAITELGAVYCGISKTFANSMNENYYFPLYGTYRTIGIIKNPAINDAIFNLSNFNRVKLAIANSTGSFVNNEIVVQPTSNSAGLVVYSNNTFLELSNVSGTFVYDPTNLANNSSKLVGWVSGSRTYATSANISYFNLSANTELLIDNQSGGSAYINQIVSNTQIRLTNLIGTFNPNDCIYESVSNSYANIVSIYTSNGTINSSTIFGQKFNNIARLTLSSNNQPFVLYEYIIQAITNATGRIISKVDELDLILSNANATFSVGDSIINSNTGSNAIVTFANSSYLKLSAVNNNGFNETNNRPFNIGNSIKNIANTKNSIINNVYSVLILDNVYGISSSNGTLYTGTFGVYSDFNHGVSGNTSGSSGQLGMVKLPDLVKNSGQVIYLQNLVNPFTKSATSVEDVNLIIKF